MVVDCLEDDNSLDVGSPGWLSCIRVRLIHSHVRAMLLSRATWDSREYGKPINQEDMMGTLLAFSVNVLDSIEKIEGKSALSVQVIFDLFLVFSLKNSYHSLSSL